MVCVPCIILPLALWIFHKFLQPIILRLMPETWRDWLNNKLYPTATCPIKKTPAEPQADDEKKPFVEEVDRREKLNGATAVSDKKTD